MELQGFKVVSLQVNKSKKSLHTIFIKENSSRVKSAEKPSGRTVIILNIPPYFTEDNLKFAFEKVGEVENIFFANKPGKHEEIIPKDLDKFLQQKRFYKYKSGYVIYKSTKSVHKVLKLESMSLLNEENETIIKSGLTKWTEDYFNNIQDEEILQKEIDEYMALYDKKQQDDIAVEKEIAKPDNDGWVTVTKRGKYPSFDQKEATANNTENNGKKRKKEKELKNFYTFQIRESKLENIVSLRKKFEEDKRKIETLKKSRRFKPF